MTDLIAQHPDIEMYLRHPDWVGGGAVKLKTLIVLLPVTLRGVYHMVTRCGLSVLTIPTGWELDVDLQL